MHGSPSESSRHNLSLKNSRRMNGEAEPLLRFSEAKKVLGDIYTDLGKHVDELDEVYKGLGAYSKGAGDGSESLVPVEQADEIALFRDSIKTIMETFRRDNMKVVFFGRTSNGKSTTINAMLHAKILPQGMGHTTCCFLQVQGCDEDNGYLLHEDDPNRIPISQLGKIGHALSSDNSDLPAMGQDSLLRVFYPKGHGEGENRLLQNDVVILDSPGVDLSPEFDSWIDKHCLDADVFVLVLNAESTLTQAEKSFFYRVAKKLSKPNVFILNNRWDASAAESEHVDDVKQQHLTRFRQFLVNELEVATDRDVKDRIFFVSSREVLESRLKARGLLKNPYQVDGHQVRAMEFEMFEKQFEHCISRSAIRTKFEAHNRRANEIIARMRANVDVVYSAANRNKEFLEKQLQDSTIVFNNCRTNFAQFERAYREQTERLRAEVHLKVSADFSEEIMRLEAIVDRFNMPFMDTKEGIAEYKRALADFTDKCVSSDLEARCTGGLMSRIWNLENDMFQYVTQILSPPYQHKLEEVWRYRAPFKFSICVDAPALTKDFHEDLEFRFTFGLSAIIRRIIAYRSGQPVTAIQTNLLTPIALRNVGRSNEDLHAEAMQKAVEENAMMTQMVLTSASYLANGSIGLLIIGGVVYRAVGWRIIAVSAATYGGLYLWERMRWNSHAKEQHLKEQFRAHLAARMQQVGAAHTTHCETQAMREMDQVFDGLRATVAGVHREMKEELDNNKKEIEKVDGTLKSLLTIKGKTAFLLRMLDHKSNWSRIVVAFYKFSSEFQRAQAIQEGFSIYAGLFRCSLVYELKEYILQTCSSDYLFPSDPL
nr:Fzo conserved region domain containing protein [Haemonchus contortus]